MYTVKLSLQSNQELSMIAVNTLNLSSTIETVIKKAVSHGHGPVEDLYSRLKVLKVK